LSSRIVDCADAETTRELGRQIAGTLSGGELILLHGELGAGKTTLVKGLADGLGADGEEVTSPTFVLHQIHQTSGHPVETLHHLDLYRLNDRTEMHALGVDELLADEKAVVAVEWPKTLMDPHLAPGVHVVTIRFETSSSGRSISITSS
jgi:tRNA threonylcarbamoyladenosine biosynthesis protein TsaE